MTNQNVQTDGADRSLVPTNSRPRRLMFGPKTAKIFVNVRRLPTSGVLVDEIMEAQNNALTLLSRRERQGPTQLLIPPTIEHLMQNDVGAEQSTDTLIANETTRLISRHPRPMH